MFSVLCWSKTKGKASVMLGVFQRWRRKRSSNVSQRGRGPVRFRGHIEQLESRTVLSASLGTADAPLPSYNPSSYDAPSFVSQQNRSDYSSYGLVGPRSDLALGSENLSGSSSSFEGSHARKSSSLDHRESSFQSSAFQGTSSSLVTIVRLYVIAERVPETSTELPRTVAATAAPASTAVDAAASPALSPEVIQVITPRLSAGVGLLVDASMLTVETAREQQSLSTENSLATGDLELLLSSNIGSSQKAEPSELESSAVDGEESKEIRFSLFDNQSDPLDALQDEREAVDELLSSLSDIPARPGESFENSQPAEKSKGLVAAREQAALPKDRSNPRTQEDSSKGGMVLLQTEGDPNQHARDLIAIVTNQGDIEATWQPGIELSVGTYMKVEIGGGPRPVDRPDSVPASHPPTPAANASARNEQAVNPQPST